MIEKTERAVFFIYNMFCWTFSRIGYYVLHLLFYVAVFYFIHFMNALVNTEVNINASYLIFFAFLGFWSSDYAESMREFFSELFRTIADIPYKLSRY